MSTNCQTFKRQLAGGDKIIGTFIKTPSSIVAEVLCLSDLDAFCIDTEHAPFGRLEADQCIAAFRAADRPSIVRIANESSTEIRNALDCGATGLLVPHVTSAKQAAIIVKHAHFGEAGRGFAGSTRASGFTRKSMQEHLRDSANQTTIIVQIEDLAALKNVSEIASVDGIDAVFIGRIDLAVAMGKSPMDAEVIATVKKICEEAAEVGCAVGMFTPDYTEIPMWQRCGCNFYLLGSDQSFVLAGANKLASVFD